MDAEQIAHCIARKRHSYSADEVVLYEESLRIALRRKMAFFDDFPYPKHRFLSYLTEEKNYLAHGTSLKNLRVLKTVRRSKDTEETGHERLLLATSDAIWAMWFAVLDKTRMGGLTSNDCIVYEDEQGEKYSLYYFSIGYTAVEKEPYQSGSLYILEPDSFTYKKGEEKGSEKSVSPLFEIEIRKEDFPYLPYVKGINIQALKQAFVEIPEKEPFLSEVSIFPMSPKIPIELRLVTSGESERSSGIQK